MKPSILAHHPWSVHHMDIVVQSWIHISLWTITPPPGHAGSVVKPHQPADYYCTTLTCWLCHEATSACGLLLNHFDMLALSWSHIRLWIITPPLKHAGSVVSHIRLWIITLPPGHSGSCEATSAYGLLLHNLDILALLWSHISLGSDFVPSFRHVVSNIDPH